NVIVRRSCWCDLLLRLGNRDFVFFRAAVQEMDLLDLEFVIRRSGAVLAGPDARATAGFIRRESAFDQDLAALLQVLLADLRQPAPGGAAEPGRDLDDLALLVGILVVGGDVEDRDRRAGRCKTHLGFAAEVTDENGFV